MDCIKKRNGCVSIWLWLAIISNLVYAFKCGFYLSSADSRLLAIGWGGLCILSIFNVLNSILLLRWLKLGFYLFTVSSCLCGLINLFIIKADVYILIAVPLSITMWWGILQLPKNGVSAWKLLEGGWDYKHCRHLYQFFASIMVGLFGLTLVIGLSKDGIRDSSPKPHALEILGEPQDSINNDDKKWKSFSDDKGLCSIEAPSSFHHANIDETQILGLFCSDSDPAVVVVTETSKSLGNVGVNTIEEYANELLRINKNDRQVGDSKIISKNEYGKNSYLIVYNLSMGETTIRYYLLSCRDKKNFYYCKIFCLEEYAEKLYPVISHMLNTFKIN